LLVRLVVELGQRLGLETLGEGIEEEAQLRALRRMGCDSGQGFHLAGPGDARLIAALLDDAAAQPAAGGTLAAGARAA
jgi:EAL domain-containing protein (putative c-di-GMP-specific phosphodiesterase class I)